MDSSTYNHLLGQIPDKCPIPHYKFPGHTILSKETLLEVCKTSKGYETDYDAKFVPNIPWYQPFPYSVQQSSVLFCGSNIKDEATELVKKKQKWEKEFQKLKIPDFDKAIVNINKCDGANLSKNMKKYIELFERDPVPNFSGDYNWLYTGGCLCQDQNSDAHFIISADCVVNKPGFNISQLSEAQDKILISSSQQLKVNSPVLQITCKSHMEKLIICVRQKNYLSVFNFNREKHVPNPVCIYKKKVLKSKFFTCLDVEANCERMIVTDSNYDINIFHIESKEKLYGHCGRNFTSVDTVDTWSQIEFGDFGVYWALRNCFGIFDHRDFQSGRKFNFELSSILSSCENISSFVKSPSDPNFVYLSTTHSILQLDLRMGKAVQKWTHLKKIPPQFMAIVKDAEDSEIMLLQSPSMEDISGISLERIENNCSINFVSKSLPCLLKSVQDTLNLARLHGVCCNPFVAKRMKFPVTGLQCLKSNEGYINLLVTNSGGDIFRSKIIRKTSESSPPDENFEEVLEEMKSYEFCVKKFVVENCEQHLKFASTRGVLSDIRRSNVENWKKRRRKFTWKHKNKYKVENLLTYKDFLAKKILNVWVPPEVRPAVDTETEQDLDTEGETLDIDAEIRLIEDKIRNRVENW